MADSIDH